LPVGTRTVLFVIEVPTGQHVSNVAVNAGSFILYNDPPYLAAMGLGTDVAYLVVLPVPGNFSVLSITVTATATATVTVYTDPELYDESVFYNGTPSITGTSATGTTTLATGPLRLLTAMVAAPSGSIAVLEIGGSAALTSTTPGGTATLSFPQPFIVVATEIVAANITTSGNVQITYTFP
jgi:hypothetical protein